MLTLNVVTLFVYLQVQYITDPAGRAPKKPCTQRIMSISISKCFAIWSQLETTWFYVICNLYKPEFSHNLYLNSKPDLHKSHKLILWFTPLTPSAVFLQGRSSLKRTLPSHTTPPPPCLALRSLRGTQDPCPPATAPPPLLRQGNSQCRSPQPGSPVSLTVLWGAQELTAGFTKTIVCVLFIYLLLPSPAVFVPCL